MSEINNNEIIEEVEEQKPNKKKLPKWAKTIIIVISVIAVLVASCATAFHFFKNQIIARAIYIAVPHSIQVQDAYDDAVEYECIIELNKDYKPDKEAGMDDILKAFKYTRIDADGSVTDLGVDYKYGDDQSAALLQFLLASGVVGKIVTIKKIATAVFAVIMIALCCVGIYLWYRSWCKRQDAEKAKMYAHQNSNKHKKKRKK